MGLFSLNNILLESDNTYNKSIDIDDIGYMDEAIREVSFVQEGYDAILEMNAYYCNAEKEFFYRIRESAGDSFIINEGFSDFFNKIKAIIKKFIDWVKKVFKEFAAKLAALVQSEKYIKKHKDLLNKFNSEDEFEFQGYKFTEITGSSIPLSNAVDAFNAKNGQGGFMPTVNLGNIFKGDSNGDYYKFTKNADDSEDLDKWDIADDEGNRDTELTRRKRATEKINQKSSDEISDMTNKNEDFYDEFRAYVLNQSGKKLDSKEFSDECFKVFRNGEDSTESITIDYNFVQDSYRNFDKYKDTIKDIEKKKNEMIKDYEDLEKQLDKLIKYNKETHKIEVDKKVGRANTQKYLQNLSTNDFTSNIIYDSSTADRVQSLMKVYSARVNQMCQIHTQAFSAKLEAAKDCFKQDKQILNKAIQQILKRSNKEGF